LGEKLPVVKRPVADIQTLRQSVLMSYDLMVFDPLAAPRNREDFLSWYDAQTQWTEQHTYDDPKITTPALASWFAEMSRTFPPMNGPFASDDFDNPMVTDYSVGQSLIYAAFAWSQAEAAFETVDRLAAKHAVGFFDVSGEEGIIRFP
jgi:hypothetical protein